MIRRTIAAALRWSWFAAQTLVMYVQFVLSLPRLPRQLVRAWPESGIALGPRVALFVHFDRRRQVRPYVLHYVAMLQRCGLSVVFVTNAGRLREDGLEALKPLCAGILMRRNVGYDFGAWREALDHLALPRYETESLLILNDSVYGPLCPLESLLERMDFSKADVWGATDSWQTRYHLQSYFFAVGRKVLVSRAWHDFWRQVRPVQSKEWVIRRYEVGLTQSLVRAGFVCGALWNYTELLRGLDPALAGIPAEAKEGEDARVNARRSHWGRIMFGGVAPAAESDVGPVAAVAAGRLSIPQAAAAAREPQCCARYCRLARRTGAHEDAERAAGGAGRRRMAARTQERHCRRYGDDRGGPQADDARPCALSAPVCPRRRSNIQSRAKPGGGPCVIC
jgi:hypothetical protein